MYNNSVIIELEVIMESSTAMICTVCMNVVALYIVVEFFLGSAKVFEDLSIGNPN